ncbi:MAG: hypothetical protein IPN33_15010 [Saprospiraceae bacterium]|nr:hypothetical protein [Saprospiraceae bacterium]
MQINAFIRVCGVCTALLLPVFCLHAQELRENERGEKIIVYPDGSWQYFGDFAAPAPDNANADTKKEKEGNKYPIFVGTVNPLESPVSVTEEDIFKIAVRRSQLAQDAASIAEKRAKEAVKAREAIEKEYTALKNRQDVDEDDLRQVQIRLDAARRAENETTLEKSRASEEVTRATKLTEKGNYLTEFKSTQQAKQQQSKLSKTQKLLAAEPFENLIPLSDNTTAGLTDRNLDLIVNPPAASCRMAYEGKDDASGQWRRDVQKQLLFTHTDERLRMFLKDKEYLRCEGFFTSLGGYRFLTLQFSFAYPNAREAYGFIEKGSTLTIKQLDGNFINLRAGKMDRGSYDTETEILTYRVHYPIDRGQMNLLKESEVDTILVFWSTGYEEYQVYQLDFFINQITCLEK